MRNVHVRYAIATIRVTIRALPTLGDLDWRT